MSNFSAIVPVAEMTSANEALEELGYGPDNFQIPAYTGTQVSHAVMHSWSDAKFQADVAALPNVTITEDGDPFAITNQVCEEVGAAWGADAPPLQGMIEANKLYRYTDETLWWAIQAYNADVYSDPYAIPALIRQARIPGVASEWVQPIDQYDSYRLPNAFTGVGDTCLYNNKTWQTLVDVNVWVPAEGPLWTEINDED